MQDPITLQPTLKPQFLEREQVKCPRCDSTNTKFCSYNNHRVSEQRHFCNTCRRYWTRTRVVEELFTQDEVLSVSHHLSPPICASSTTKESNKPRGGPRDIAWQHGVSIDNGKKSRCNYCEKVMNSGGATRLKQHLAGVFTNVEQCPHCPPQVRSTMVRLLKQGEEYRLEKERESERPPEHVEDDEVKDPQVQHLQHANAPFLWTGSLSYEVGSSSTRRVQLVHDFGDTSSRALNIKNYYGSSKTVKSKCGVKRGPWTAEEDQRLVSYMEQYGDGNWTTLPQNAGLLRSHTNCRLRWTNYLRPDIKKEDFTTEEEDSIMTLYGNLGNRWSAIAAKLPGRTVTQIKDVWHTHLKNRLTLNKSNPRARHRSVELSNSEAKTEKKPKCMPKTDLIVVQSVSATSSLDMDLDPFSDLDTFMELELSPDSISSHRFL